MDNSFDACMDLGERGELLVKQALESVFIQVKKVPSDINIQLEYGDIWIKGCRHIGMEPIKVEVKTEHKHTGNLFWEWWSNKEAGRSGWGRTSPANILYYLFWDDGIGYVIRDMQNLMWLVSYYKNEFKLIQQAKYAQGNDTWGYLLPVQWVVETTYAERFDFSHLKGEIE